MSVKYKSITKKYLYYLMFFLSTSLAWIFINITGFPVLDNYLTKYDLSNNYLQYVYSFSKFVFKYGDSIFYITILLSIIIELICSIYKKYDFDILRIILFIYNTILLIGLVCICTIFSLCLDDGLAVLKKIDTEKR